MWPRKPLVVPPTKCCALHFNRRELREAFKWGDTRLRIHLEELVEMEYVVPLSGRFGQTYQYRLVLADGQHAALEQGGRFLAGLKSVEQLRREAIGLCGSHLAGVLTAGPCGRPRPQKGDLAPPSQVPGCEVQNPVPASKDEAFTNPPANLAPFGGEHISNLQKPRVNGALISVSTGGDL